MLVLVARAIAALTLLGVVASPIGTDYWSINEVDSDYWSINQA